MAFPVYKYFTRITFVAVNVSVYYYLIIHNRTPSYRIFTSGIVTYRIITSIVEPMIPLHQAPSNPSKLYSPLILLQTSFSPSLNLLPALPTHLFALPQIPSSSPPLITPPTLAFSLLSFTSIALL